MPKHKPHIIYIISDEHRGQAMSHMGDPNLQTPTMDRLANEGVSFSRAYANCPICTPSRGTMFSGRHAHAGPVAGFFDVFKPSAPSTATLLREQGYRTAYFGKWHCGIIRDQTSEWTQAHKDQFPGNTARTPENLRAGFQDWFGFECTNAPFNSYVYKDNEPNPTPLDGYQTDALTDLAIEYIRTYERDEPLFLVLSVEPPHFPCVVPEEWKRFDPAALQVGPSFAKLDPFFSGTWGEFAEDDLRQILANYLAMVENLDWNLGRLMDALAGTAGFGEDTLTVYFADHGDYVGNHGLDTTKIHHHEESVRIPALFHWPGGIEPRGRIDGLFSLVDLMATTLGLAGVPVPTWSQGTDFSPAIRGEACTGPQEVLIEMHNNPRWNPRFTDWRGLVTDRYKYAFYEDRREVLFDLQDDPYELNDIAAAQPEQTAAMRARLLEVLAEAREPYFDVIVEHGVAAETPRYITHFEGQVRGARHKGGLD